MPSWNIHTAHVERLLAEDAPSALGIRDVNAFLFGNLVPDIYVGYMVPDTSRTIAYQETHFADRATCPCRATRSSSSASWRRRLRAASSPTWSWAPGPTWWRITSTTSASTSSSTASA